MQSNIRATHMNTQRKALYHANHHKSRGESHGFSVLAGASPLWRQRSELGAGFKGATAPLWGILPGGQVTGCPPMFSFLRRRRRRAEPPRKGEGGEEWQGGSL